ncbi:hypothetical protein HYX02_01565 [Candidatus Woesearchaeota archaeon]|nr:hypothetical protein [Candidatus Woesearchaeota archaeon]
MLDNIMYEIIVGNDLTPEELAITGLPDETLDYALIKFVVQTRGYELIIHNSPTSYAQVIPVGYAGVVNSIANTVGEKPLTIEFPRINLKSRLTQGSIADLVQKLEEISPWVKISEVHFLNVPKSAYYKSPLRDKLRGSLCP